MSFANRGQFALRYSDHFKRSLLSATIAALVADDKSVKVLYRLEVAEDESFTIGYRSFPNLEETVFVVENLKPKTVYFVKLQAYYDSVDHSLAPSVPEITSTTTGSILSPPANFELTVGYGKFSIRWEPPSHAEGKLDYLIWLYNEESTEKPFEIRETKVPFIKDWKVAPEKDYLLVLKT